MKKTVIHAFAVGTSIAFAYSGIPFGIEVDAFNVPSVATDDDLGARARNAERESRGEEAERRVRSEIDRGRVEGEVDALRPLKEVIVGTV